MSEDDCVFCKIVAGEVPVAKIHEDEAVLVFLDSGRFRNVFFYIFLAPHSILLPSL